MKILAVVMYRNPAEEWLWESGVVYWFWGGVLLAAGAICFTHWIAGVIERRRERRRKGPGSCRTS